MVKVVKIKNKSGTNGHIHYGEESNVILVKGSYRGAWVAQSVKRPTLAQVMISQSVGSSPASDGALC